MALQTGSSTLLEEETKKRTKLSPRWRILGINDDVTPMEYVVMLLQEVFGKTHDAAFKIMMEVHERGAAVFYVGTREVCELKVEQVQTMNEKHKQKLQVRMEPAEE